MLTNEQAKSAGAQGWTQERRAAKSEEMRQRAERLRQGLPTKRPVGRPRKASAYAPSPSSAPSSPSPLPPSPGVRSPPDLAVVERAMAALEKMGLTQETAGKETKLLPESPDDLERALKLARLPARIPVMAFDETFQALGARGFSENERDEGIQAWAALFWQWGLYRDGRVLVALWTFGVMVPRFVDWYEDRRKRRESLIDSRREESNGAQPIATQAAPAPPA